MDYQRELNLALAEPVTQVYERERMAFDRLLAEHNRRLVLFGAGNIGRKSLACLRSAGVEPLAFADNSPQKWGTRVDGLPVLQPADAAGQFGASALFLVSIWWSTGYCCRETRNQLQKLGCRSVVDMSALRWRFADQLLPYYCLDLPHKLYEQLDSVRRAALVWADEDSCLEYLSQIRWRALGDPDALRPFHPEESYFVGSLFQWSQNEVFVDCGAYTGDTARRLLELRRDNVSRIIALEPDPGNYARLLQWIGSVDSDVASRVRPLPLAAGARSCTLRFRSDGTEGAALDEHGETVVQCERLDDMLADEQPSYIKMDIEGAEADALIGAEAVIGRHQPVLAICVYHRQSDIWDIPLWLRTRFPEYRLFLRSHEDDGKQLVCYAVPCHRLA